LRSRDGEASRDNPNVFLATALNRPRERREETNRKTWLPFANYILFESPVSRFVVPSTIEEMEEKGVVFRLEGVHKNVIGFCCVTTRLLYENGVEFARYWSQLVKDGIDPWVAVALTARVTPEKKVSQDGTAYNSYTYRRIRNHHPFAYGLSTDGLKNLRDHTFAYGPVPAEGSGAVENAAYNLNYSGMTAAVSGKTGDVTCKLTSLLEDSMNTFDIDGRDPNNLNPWGAHPPHQTIKAIDARALREKLAEVR
jgi:hypothetical protein